jgi:hypothetical protein
MFGWVLFRAENMQQFETFSADMLGFALHRQSAYDIQISRMFVESPLPLAFLLYGIFNLTLYFASTIEHKKASLKHTAFLCWMRPPLSARIVIVAGAACLILGLAPRSAVPFIYFQF